VSITEAVLDKIFMTYACFSSGVTATSMGPWSPPCWWFVINYSPDKAVRFDRNGQPIAILDKAVVLRLGGRPVIAEAMGLVFG
jgi:hypothetical protein